jgi:F-type H+-transporting ATPase subunit a
MIIKTWFRKLSIIAPIVLGALLLWPQPAEALAAGAKEAHSDGHKEKKFDVSGMILHHILDAHEWHIATIGDKHISIPLPVILYDREEKKWVSFSSSHFHHGYEAYRGYMISHEAPNNGKIVKVVPGTKEIDSSASLPLDFSITKNVLSIFLSIIFLSWLFISIARRYTRNTQAAPRGVQNFLEPLILFLRDELAIPSIGEKKYERFMPFLLTLFFFIFFNNLLGLIPIFPGGANVTGNITVTLVLALFTFAITNFSGNKAYWMHIFNAPGVPWWLKFPLPLLPIVELIGVLTKPFVLMVRLFANISAGHIIILGFFSLIFIFGEMAPSLGYGVSVLSVAFAIFMNFLEFLVAFIQAYVFTLLSALYFGLATEEHAH